MPFFSYLERMSSCDLQSKRNPPASLPKAWEHCYSSEYRFDLSAAQHFCRKWANSSHQFIFRCGVLNNQPKRLPFSCVQRTSFRKTSAVGLSAACISCQVEFVEELRAGELIIIDFATLQSAHGKRNTIGLSPALICGVSTKSSGLGMVLKLKNCVYICNK